MLGLLGSSYKLQGKKCDAGPQALELFKLHDFRPCQGISPKEFCRSVLANCHSSWCLPGPSKRAMVKRAANVDGQDCMEKQHFEW